MWEPALGGRGPAGWPRPISGVSDLTVAARGQPPGMGAFTPQTRPVGAHFSPKSWLSTMDQHVPPR